MPTKTGKYPKSILILTGLLLLIIIGLYYYRISSPLSSNPSQVLPSAKPDLNGIYKGNLPCADCPGITETLVLASDGSYISEDLYLEKSEKPLRVLGKWIILNSNVLKLTPGDNSQPAYFQILENGNLQMLDSNMQKIDSPFNQILTKQ